MSEWLNVKNLLAVRLDNIGDVVMTGPALRAIKENLPETKITMLLSPGGASAAPLLPWIDEVIAWKSLWQDLGDLPFDPARELELVEKLREHAFDGAIIFTSFSQDPHIPGYVCYLAGIPLRAGESKEFGGSVLTHELKSVPDNVHQVERNLRLIESLGFKVRDRSLKIFIDEEASLSAHEKLGSMGIRVDEGYVVIHPGASASARRYPVDKFAVIAQELTRKGIHVVVTGSDRERLLVEGIADAAPEVKTLVGVTSISEYAAVLKMAKAVICNNTLPMHLSDALRVPVVVLFSGTDEESAWGPRDTRALLMRKPTPCHPCYLFKCPIGQPCLDIPPHEVSKAVLRIIS